MKTTDFAKYLSDFLGQYLPSECGMSQNTVKSYSQTFLLLLEYLHTEERIKPESVCLKDFTKKRVVAFLRWLESYRNSSVSTRNARLGAIHSFAKYLQYRNILHLSNWQEIMSIKNKKSRIREMEYLTIEALKLLLRQPNLKTRIGRRDFVLLSLLYDSGARVQELINITPADIRFDETTTVRLFGKGPKVRVVPLSSTQVANLKRYMEECGMNEASRRNLPLFPNPQGNMLSRMAVLNIVHKYYNMAKALSPDIMPPRLGCHSLRHSKAMHMLDAEINLVYIRDFLGHVSTTTTEVYARASEKKKQEALAKLNPGIITNKKSSWKKDKALLTYLKGLRQKY